MIRHGHLCKGCGKECVKDARTISVACPVCREAGCENCDGGRFTVECPSAFVGLELPDAINLASMCGKGDWPVSGGLLKQAAWFIDLYQTLRNEDAWIENDEIERMKSKVK